MAKYNATKDVNKIIKFGKEQDKIKLEQEKLGISKKKLMGGGRVKYASGTKPLNAGQIALKEKHPEVAAKIGFKKGGRTGYNMGGRIKYKGGGGVGCAKRGFGIELKKGKKR